MSLEQIWIRKVIRPPAARADASRLLERASAQRVDGTLIVGPGLTTNGKCYLARWDGWELAVVELGSVQQSDWNVNPRELYQELHSPQMSMRESITEPMVSLTDAHIDGATHDGLTPMSGTCRFELDRFLPGGIENSALRARYFRPDLPCSIMAMWYADTILNEPHGELHFRFPPMFSGENPDPLRGTLIVFLQLFTAENWVTQSGCRKISNVASTMITLR